MGIYGFLSAASQETAAKAGSRVLLVDERPDFGGNLNFANDNYNKINELAPLEWIKKTFSEL